METPDVFRSPHAESIWRAPLVPVALVVTAGVVADRYLPLPLAGSLLLALAGLVAWFVCRESRSGLALVYLGLAAAALGAAYHHWRLHVHAADDVSFFVQKDPQLVRLRGVLDEEPVTRTSPPRDPLQSFPSLGSTVATLRVSALHGEDDWQPVSGGVRLVIAGPWSRGHVGDEIELVGWLEPLPAPANPGEADARVRFRDQGIRALLRVRPAADEGAVSLPARIRNPLDLLIRARGWCQQQLHKHVPDRAGLAVALLLGDGSALAQAEWDQYMRTGVVHALAISGQHLVILAGFWWWVLRLTGVRRRRGALLIAGFLLAYTFLVGGRPPVVRAAVIVCVACGAILLRRPVVVANSFALAWLVVIGIQPADILTPGCQLSFLATAVLYWGVSYLRQEKDPLEILLEQSWPLWQQQLLRLGRFIAFSYLVNLATWLAIAPLVAAHYHTIPPVALLIGPPVALLMALALIFGFLVLLLAPVFGPAAALMGRLTALCLSTCDTLVDAADQLAMFRWYVGDIPTWWLCGVYLTMLGLLLWRSLRLRWRWLAPAAAAWLCVGLVSGSSRPNPGELRCTFLSVGHGGCTVLETPDGRTLVYDAGAMSGPEVVRRHIAPFLWHRGIRRIDELFLSHADLDHFNGVPTLLELFTVGQVTWTPSFRERSTAGVRLVVETLERHRIPVRAVSADDRLSAGEITLHVLHPPLEGPEGNENARSLVLLVQHAGHCILLTGDLEGSGLNHVLRQPPTPVHVLMAPHHGSRAANTPELATWARPRVVVSSQGFRHNLKALEAPYVQAGAQFFDTAQHGAITIRSTPAGLTLETFRTNQRLAVTSMR